RTTGSPEPAVTVVDTEAVDPDHVVGDLAERPRRRLRPGRARAADGEQQDGPGDDTHRPLSSRPVLRGRNRGLAEAIRCGPDGARPGRVCQATAAQRRLEKKRAGRGSAASPGA